jgi:putative nucleotidyltransferase with HDIG domain
MDELKPFLETSYSLLEMCKSVAPGTYAHSLTVANICEPIARDLELNVEIMRCAALYHDIGKIICPQYFTENQNGSGINPHDHLDPYISYLIITAHVDRSISILCEHNMPLQIINIVAEHHGNSILKPIYDKCKDNDVCEDTFRYKHKKPKSVYSAILMIVDVITAAAVSKQYNEKLASLEERTNFVHSIITRLENDRQLDELKTGQKLDIQTRLIRELETFVQKREVKYEEEVK